MHIRSYLAALEFVNETRAGLGLEPLERLPGGRPGDSLRCAIARAVPGASVSSILVHGKEAKLLPSEVRRFVTSFDLEGAGRVECRPGDLVQGGIDEDKGCLVPA